MRERGRNGGAAAGAIPGRRPAAALSAIPLHTLLETIEEFGMASVLDVSWALSLPVSQVTAVWDRAEIECLIAPRQRCPDTGDQLYGLTLRGGTWLQATGRLKITPGTLAGLADSQPDPRDRARAPRGD
jgi:hypothetical protein